MTAAGLMYEQVLAKHGKSVDEMFRGRTCRVEQCYAPIQEGSIMCAHCQREYEEGRVMLSYRHSFDETVTVTGRRVR